MEENNNNINKPAEQQENDPQQPEQQHPLELTSKTFSNQFVELVCEEDLDTIKQRQKEMYGRLRHSNQSLKQFNDDTQKKLSVVHFDYQGHARMLREMKSDLEYVTRKIKLIKARTEQVNQLSMENSAI